jgi:N-acetyl-anhydromuramyl-L-alanine amidase AmpD
MLEPDPVPFHIIQYSPAVARLTAYSPRYGAKIRLIVLIGDPGPASQSLGAMTTLGARASTHYYVASDATIYQVVDDAFAAWHTGMGVWDGRRQNINRISLGVAIEHGSAGYVEAQLAALAWLVDTLRARYGLPIAAVVRQSELDTHHGGVLAGFPWAGFVARLARR